ncbi:MAG: DUF3822 family protein [Bacteroidota bacterium]
MGVVRYDIQEASFAASASAQYELSILAGVDSSSYLLADSLGAVQCVRAIQHGSGSAAWWTTDEFMQRSYAKSRLAWLEPRFTLVPTRLYNAEKRRTYLETLTNLREGDTIMADVLPQLDLVLIYAVAQAQLTSWRHTLVGCRFYHVLTPILRQLSQLTQLSGLPRIFAYQHDKILLTIAIDRGQVVFCNAFHCQAAKDVLYYILLTYEQCKWEPQRVALRLFGELTTDAEIYKLCYRYVRDMDFLPTKQLVSWGPVASEHPEHLFFALAALHHYQPS